MDKPEKTLVLDGEVASLVMDIIRQAHKHVVVVTPYLDMWGLAQDELGLAVKRGVDIRFIIRSGHDPRENSKAREQKKEGITWLLGNGVRVLEVERLHAKIYFNENTVVVSSMNFTEFSTVNSRELALVVQDEQDQQRIRDYVRKTLMPLARPVDNPTPEPSRRSVRESTRPYPVPVTGHCIRCGRPVPLDPDKPLCRACYEEWAEWENADYEEEFCHACGKPSKTSYARPLCRACYSIVR